MSEKIIIALISASVSIITVILASVLNRFIKKGGKSKKTNENINKGRKVTNPLQIATGDRSKFTINIYHNFPNKNSLTIPEVEIDKNEPKNQKEKVEKGEKTTRKSPIKSEEQSEKEMPQQEFERLLMKIKFIAFRIMRNIKWDKVEPLEFRKNEEGKEFAKLTFEIENKWCSIVYEITEKDKQKFLKTSTFEIVERFITLRLVNYGKNDYFDYRCPDCKQTTLTKSSVINDPGKEWISCVLCRWAMSMKVYREYLEDKKHNPSLEFYEWLDERNKRMARERKERTKSF